MLKNKLRVLLLSLILNNNNYHGMEKDLTIKKSSSIRKNSYKKKGNSILDLYDLGFKFQNLKIKNPKIKEEEKNHLSKSKVKEEKNHLSKSKVKKEKNHLSKSKIKEEKNHLNKSKVKENKLECTKELKKKEINNIQINKIENDLYGILIKINYKKENYEIFLKINEIFSKETIIQFQDIYLELFNQSLKYLNFSKNKIDNHRLLKNNFKNLYNIFVRIKNLIMNQGIPSKKENNLLNMIFKSVYNEIYFTYKHEYFQETILIKEILEQISYIENQEINTYKLLELIFKNPKIFNEKALLEIKDVLTENNKNYITNNKIESQSKEKLEEINEELIYNLKYNIIIQGDKYIFNSDYNYEK